MEKYKYRTQLYLDEAQYLFLKESAAKYGKSIAEVVRTLIDREMGAEDAVAEKDPLFHLASTAVKTGRIDGSTEHDRYIYRSGKPDRCSLVQNGDSDR
ncbi:MAG TPA: hypothetical protein GX509_05055 [Firmicutes bacterium]|nr:hypothetical protein [Bacillota bacterium]HHY98086.1 hypothetical protein [Bacillota bacterium]